LGEPVVPLAELDAAAPNNPVLVYQQFFLRRDLMFFKLPP
jgi:hypothetical protein